MASTPQIVILTALLSMAAPPAEAPRPQIAINAIRVVHATIAGMVAMVACPPSSKASQDTGGSRTTAGSAMFRQSDVMGFTGVGSEGLNRADIQGHLRPLH